jgi:predicted dehydrogenase
MREAYSDKGIDAVSIATPNHWHVLSAYWAVKAGKDVYCEKPVSHNMFESKQLLAAARKYDRIVQVGQQSRSIPHKMKAAQLLRDGVIGKVYMAKGLCYKRRKSIGHKPDQPTPAGVNWDLFLGPAPLRPFNELRFRYNWHWFWDTGNGDIGNQGVHEMDVASWGLGKTTHPKTVYSYGGKFVYDDDQETPNTQTAEFDFGDCQMVFEVRGLITTEEGGLKHRGGNVVGNIFFGSDGVLAMDGNGFQVYKGEDRQLVMDEKLERTGPSETGAHMSNFLAAVKSRKWQDLHCDVSIAGIAADCCHMANASYRTGKKLKFDEKTGKFDDAEANKYISRNYRAPYVVPANV